MTGRMFIIKLTMVSCFWGTLVMGASKKSAFKPSDSKEQTQLPSLKPLLKNFQKYGLSVSTKLVKNPKEIVKVTLKRKKKKEPVVIKELVTRTGKVYKNVEIGAFTASGITIFHDAGCITIKKDELPDEILNKFAAQMNKAEERLKQDKKLLRAYKKELLEKTNLYRYDTYTTTPTRFCYACKGEGKIKKMVLVEKRRVTHKKYKQVYQTCDKCNGKGYTGGETAVVKKEVRATPEEFALMLVDSPAATSMKIKILEVYDAEHVVLATVDSSRIYISGVYTAELKNRKGSYYQCKAVYTGTRNRWTREYSLVPLSVVDKYKIAD